MTIDKEQFFGDPDFKALVTQNLKLENELTEIRVKNARRDLEHELSRGEEVGQFQFVGVVHEASVHVLINKLESWTRRNPGGTIEILLNSGGGSVVDGLALVDYLRLLQKRGHHVRIIGYGLVASMAASVLMAADERVMTPRCYLGLHEVSAMVQGTISVQEDGLKFSKELQEKIVDLLCEKSALTPRKLKNMWERKDVYIGAADALKLKLIDRVEDC